jgi:hypothetical protein
MLKKNRSGKLEGNEERTINAIIPTLDYVF